MLVVKDLHLYLGEFNLRGVSLNVPSGKYMVVLGPSGAGKTLLLECIAGLRKPTKGRIIIDDVDVTNLPPEKRGLAYVPQDYALWPHMSAYDNIAYPLRCRRVPKVEIHRQVKWIAEELGISHLLHRKPPSLSSGEQQRVALARALVWNPKAILLDEPTASLNPSLRHTAWRLLRKLYSKLGFTAIHVTHDLAEASALANIAAFMYDGKIIKQGSLDEILSTKEASMYLGDVNIYRGRVIDVHEGVIVANVNGEHMAMVANANVGEEIVFMLRPEEVILTTSKTHTSARNVMMAHVENIEPRGPLFLVEVRTERGLKIKAYITKASLEYLGSSKGREVYVMFKASSIKRII